MSQILNYLRQALCIWKAPGNEGRRVQALVASARWLANKKFSRQAWTIPVWQDQKLRCYPDSVIANHVIQRSPWFDAEVSRFIAAFLRPGDVFVDAGANIGLYTLQAAALVGPEGQVHAVEPSPANSQWLRENLAINGPLPQVTVHDCALGEVTGQMSFAEEDALAHLRPGGDGQVVVPVKRFEEIAPDGLIQLVKIDVEGYEFAVLRGAEAVLRSERMPVILLEMNYSLRRYAWEPEDLFRHLRDRGYTLGQYLPATHKIHQGENLEGDLVAYSPLGKALITERLGNVW